MPDFSLSSDPKSKGIKPFPGKRPLWMPEWVHKQKTTKEILRPSGLQRE
jgi:hypothetical protein